MELISMPYEMIITEDAQNDIDEYVDTIIHTFCAPMTAKKHRDEIFNTLREIRKNPTAFSVRTSASLLRYGYNVRRANFKKMAIIYTIHGSTVYIHRVVAASMITDS